MKIRLVMEDGSSKEVCGKVLTEGKKTTVLLPKEKVTDDVRQ